jgi:hypothetical protein
MNARAKRIAAIEKQRPDLASMTDDELRCYANTLKPGSHEQIAAVLAVVGQRGSTLPILKNDPERSFRIVTKKDPK